MGYNSEKTSWIVAYDIPQSLGDSWTSAKVMAWKLLDLPNARMAPPQDIEIYSDAGRSWWQAVVDILMFTQGWVDLAAELRRWRMNVYQPTNQVLSFVKNTWGESLIALEWYLLQHPHANQNISDYVQVCRGEQRLNDYPPRLIDFGLARDLYDKLIELDTDIPVANLVELLFDKRTAIDYLDGESPMGSDSAHLAMHFITEWVHYERLLDTHDRLLVTPQMAFLHLQRYEGWYHRIHMLRQKSLGTERDVTDKQISKIVVNIEGIGCLGTFVFDNDLNCFVRSSADFSEKSSKDYVTESPRYGFALNLEMSHALLPHLHHFDSWEDEPIEELEISVRDEVGLAGFMGYCIGNRNDWQEGQDQYWSRVNGKWVSGWMEPEGQHYHNCLSAMAKGTHLNPKDSPIQQMIDGARIFDIQPWAASFIIDLWDSLPEFPCVLAKIAEQDRDMEVSLSSLPPDYSKSLETFLQHHISKVKRHKDLFWAQDLPSLLSGESLTAHEILSALHEWLT